MLPSCLNGQRNFHYPQGFSGVANITLGFVPPRFSFTKRKGGRGARSGDRSGGRLRIGGDKWGHLSGIPDSNPAVVLALPMLEGIQ